MRSAHGNKTSNRNSEKDLKMRKGKMIAQGAHASMMGLTTKLSHWKADIYRGTFDPEEEAWYFGTFKKVCVYVNSEEELMEIHQKAVEAGLKSNIVTDMGHTEFHGVPTKTCLAIGPNKIEEIDKITGNLPLL